MIYSSNLYICLGEALSCVYGKFGFFYVIVEFTVTLQRNW